MPADLLTLRQGCLVILNDIQNTSLYSQGEGERYKAVALNQFINQSMHFYERLLNARYQGYLSDKIFLDVLQGITEYNLDEATVEGHEFRSPIYEARRIIDNANYYLTTRAPYLYNLPLQQIPNSVWLPAYWLEGNTINFDSPPGADEEEAVIIRFQKKLADLTDEDENTLDDQLYDAEGCIKLRASIRALKTKDVSGALKTIGGWEKELAEEELTFFQQVGNRYVPPQKPMPVGYTDDYLF